MTKDQAVPCPLVSQISQLRTYFLETSKHEDDYAADIFQDALEHFRFFQISENMDDIKIILSKNKIFQGW